VIGADGSLTGYGGGIERKRWLLDHENAAYRDPVVIPAQAGTQAATGSPLSRG
jgi:hypothetical protein